MKLMNLVLIGSVIVWTAPVVNKAEGIDFSIGGGYPFLLVPEVSFVIGEGEQRLFVNQKVGLVDEGFSLGFEQSIGSSDKNTVGVLIGALGIQKDNRPCEVDDFGELFGCIIGEVFDFETTVGIGASYSHSFSGINKRGWRVRFELGYGEGSNSNEKRVDGGIIISYQF